MDKTESLFKRQVAATEALNKNLLDIAKSLRVISEYAQQAKDDRLAQQEMNKRIYEGIATNTGYDQEK